jgi:signal transduction histidine kinase
MRAEAVEQSADLHEAFERQEMILRVSTAIRNELNLDAVLQIAVTAVGKAFNASRCAFFKVERGTLIRPSHGYIAPGAPPGPFPLIDSATNPYVRTIFAGRPVVVADLHEDPYFATHTGMRLIDTRSLLAVPVIHKGQVLGALSVHQAGRERRWRDEEVCCFSIIADQLAMAIRAAQQYEAAELRAEELQRANTELMSLARMKADLLGNVTHEFRTPLNDVIAYGSSILDGVFGSVTDPLRDAAARIVGGGDRLRRFVDELIDASRLASDDFDVHLTEVEYGTLCESVTRHLAPVAAAKGLAMHVDVLPKLPNVVGDPERLERVLTHLLNNAVKFTPAGAVELRLFLSEGMVVTEVHDTGIGIDSNLQQRVFEQFYQVDQGLTREFGGSGLGLYLSERFLAAMGSTLRVESTPGEGSTFRFNLPLAN